VGRRGRDALGVVAGLGVFGAAWWQARNLEVHPVEEDTLRALNDAPPHAYAPVAAIMQLGSLGGGLGAATLVARVAGPRRGVTTASAVTAVWLGAKLVKQVTGRGRPADHLDEVVVRGRPQSGLGFPSGHAAVATAVAVAAWPVVPRSLGLGLAAAAATTVAARVYVGAHLPLDVVGGAGMGLAAGCAARFAPR